MDEKNQQILELEKRVERLESAVSALMEFISTDGTTLLIRTKGDISIEAANFTASATVNALVRGGAAAELSAPGMTAIKGAMVQIN